MVHDNEYSNQKILKSTYQKLKNFRLYNNKWIDLSIAAKKYNKEVLIWKEYFDLYYSEDKEIISSVTGYCLSFHNFFDCIDIESTKNFASFFYAKVLLSV